MGVELRYYEKGNTYYLQVQPKEYFQIEKKIKRIRREMNHLSDSNLPEYLNLARKIELLRKKKENSRYFVPVTSPQTVVGLKARPMFQKPTVVRMMSEKDFADLLQGCLPE